MKYLSALLAITCVMAHPMVRGEDATVADPQVAETRTTSESHDSALADLCATYAEEDGIAADKKAAYVNECLNSMTDLSEGVQEGLPLVAEAGEGGPAIAPSSAQANSTPEKLVQSELVETPDPSAEQLNTGK